MEHINSRFNLWLKEYYLDHNQKQNRYVIYDTKNDAVNDIKKDITIDTANDAKNNATTQ